MKPFFIFIFLKGTSQCKDKINAVALHGVGCVEAVWPVFRQHSSTLERGTTALSTQELLSPDPPSRPAIWATPLSPGHFSFKSSSQLVVKEERPSSMWGLPTDDQRKQGQR